MIGVAFAPVLGKYAGGICERHHRMPNLGSLPAGHYSVNTVVLSQASRGQRLSDGVMSMTLTHEIGHAFGAHHDEDFRDQPVCVPHENSQYGKYAMTNTVSPGARRAHNWMFSICSRQSMQPIVMNKGHCLKPRRPSYCGNGVVEGGKQCDCGTTYTCQVVDKCCTPLSLFPSSSPGRACKLRGRCSPRVHRCCTDECTVAAAGVTCRPRTDCASESRCDGRSPSCPAPELAGYGTPCADGRESCWYGKCPLTPCHRAGLVPCLCRRPFNHACSLCCKCRDAPDDACVPAQWLHLVDPSHPLLLLPGASCVHYGQCDNDARCVYY